MRAMYYAMFGQMKKQLRQMATWFDAAETHASAKSFDVNVLTQARLSPDQFPLVRQVQIACDTAKLGASRLTGKDAPGQPDTEKTFEELRARIASVLAYLDGFTPEDFEGTKTRVVTQPRWEGKIMDGGDYFLEHVVPNFYFHTTHVYALLRHNGVPVGKRDYLGPLSQRMP
jgi:uncharacterized protein